LKVSGLQHLLLRLAFRDEESNAESVR
jgi:hypothetical protein